MQFVSKSSDDLSEIFRIGKSIGTFISGYQSLRKMKGELLLNVYRDSICDDKNVLNPDGIIGQHCEDTKGHWIANIYMVKRVNVMLYVKYFLLQ